MLVWTENFCKGESMDTREAIQALETFWLLPRWLQQHIIVQVLAMLRETEKKED